MALNPGDSLSNDHYRITRQLGRGGYGFVYQASDTLLDRDVAIKELIPGLVGDEVELKRFLVEARATMELTHECIVRTHNVFQEAGNYYIVMEYMPGGSLEERLRNQGPLPTGEAVRIAAEICEGLSFAHERGVVHCDLKPANILFTANGSAKVADFGIAHVSEEVLTRTWRTPEGFVAGTLPYMSPEQADGVRDEPQVDVYALGAVLYRMLTGQTYLEFDTRETPGATADNVYRIRSQEPKPPSAHNRLVPAWLDQVVLKALAKLPDDRYVGAEAMRAALLDGGQHAPVASPSIPPPPRLISDQPEPRPLPRWFWLLVIATAAVLVVLIIAVGVALRGGDSADKGIPQQTGTAVAAATTAPTLSPSQAATATAVPTRTDPPRRMETFTNTPAPTLTSTPRPTASRTPRVTDTPLPPTPTDVPQPTITLAPTAIPVPKAPQAGEARTRSKDDTTMIFVPAGEFLMGSTDRDIDIILEECRECSRDFFADEQPQHTVVLDAFWIDRTEVTNAQYEKCVAAGVCRVADMGSYDPRGNPNLPVVQVTWNDANAYCQWAGARLPTEAEWEKAARGTDGRRYPWGNEAVNCGRANYAAADGHCVGNTTPVGSYSSTGASPYGVWDMAGNVWEWVNDWYDPNYYAQSPVLNPLGPDEREYRVVKGGSWNDGHRNMRPADRGRRRPHDRYGLIGFRCAASPAE